MPAAVAQRGHHFAEVNLHLIECFLSGVSRTGCMLFSELFELEPELIDGWAEFGSCKKLGIARKEWAPAEWVFPC